MNAALTEHFEGFSATPYPDPYAGPDGEPWTQGFGHTSRAGPPAVLPDSAAWSREYAAQVLAQDMQGCEAVVTQYATVPLNPNQTDALADFCYNVGPARFVSSGVLRAVNMNRFDLVRSRLMLWTKARGRTRMGLVKRRHAEADLFERPVAAALMAEPPMELTDTELADMRGCRFQVECEREDLWPEDGHDPFGKPLLQHRPVWAGISGAFSGGGIYALSSIANSNWFTILIVLGFGSFWLLFFWVMYRKQIERGMVTGIFKGEPQ